MTARALVVAGVCLALAACSSVTRMMSDIYRPDYYVVEPGDTVYSIAWRYHLDHKDLMRWNRIGNPRTLQPGVRLRLDPDAAIPERAAGRSRRKAVSGAGAVAGSDRGSDGRWAAASPQGAGPDQWRWPAEGELVGTFGDGRVAGRGVDIGGKTGQPVRATAAGEVVYSGAGLKAYGRLLIIRHSGDYLSAYAHNSELLVGEGERVEAGQTIARMGRPADGSALLHFEIRHSGRPVDPMKYLPARD